MRRVLTLVIFLAAAVQSAAADIFDGQVTEDIQYYDVSATTAWGLRKEMQRKGPKGYWGYARWWVSWTADCDVTVKQTIHMPRHRNPEKLSPELRERWDSMLGALLRHERQHARHGELAAQQIAAANCVGAYEIIDRWAAQDKAYDLRTDHGRKEGVTLPQK